MIDDVTRAQAMLLQKTLQHCAAHLPPKALAALRNELAAIRDRAARGDTDQQRGIVEACDMALADLMIEDMRDLPPPERHH